MRRRVVAAMVPLMVSCANTPREKPRASVPKVDDPSPAGAMQAGVELVQARPCPVGFVIENGGRVDCRTPQTALADLDHDGHPDCIRWTRCGPDQPTLLADGGFEYPHDVLTAIRSDATTMWNLYTNQQAADAERFEELAVLRFGNADERILARAEGYGSGNVHIWSVIDVVAGVPRRWTEPSVQEAFAAMVSADERIGKQFGRGLEIEDGTLEVGRLVYRPGDPQCCPSAGLVKARLLPTTEGFRVSRAWREPLR